MKESKLKIALEYIEKELTESQQKIDSEDSEFTKEYYYGRRDILREILPQLKGALNGPKQ